LEIALIDNIYIRVFILFSCILLSSCATKSNKRSPLVIEQDRLNAIVLNKINISSEHISRSLNQLNVMESQKYKVDDMPFSHTTITKELNRQVSISWYGPVIPVLRKMANILGYKLQIYGIDNNLPVIIILGNSAKPYSDTILHTITNIAIQSSKRCRIQILVKQKIISLRYL
jgi:hypothetical protein